LCLLELDPELGSPADGARFGFWHSNLPGLRAAA
jgi:hypothetical protein